MTGTSCATCSRCSATTVFIFFDRENELPEVADKDPQVPWDRWKRNVGAAIQALSKRTFTACFWVPMMSMVWQSLAA
jgi:hypothetical protein